MPLDSAAGRTADVASHRTVLPGGLRVITESLPTVRSASFGIWAGVGSRDEDRRHAGATHYLEHLLFKGTPRRSALDISAAIDAVGGELNAFTAKEYTCYYARVLDADLPLAIDVLSDMVTSSLLEPKDVDAERGVILEEIAMNDDDPADIVHEAFSAPAVRRHPARPADPRHRRLDQRDHPGRDRRALRRAVHAGRTWWSPPPATSTTTRSCGWSERRSAPVLDGPAAAPGAATAARRRADRRAPPAPACGWCPGRSSRRTWCSAARGLARTDDRTVRARRAERRARRRHVVAAVPGGPGEARAGLLGVQLQLAARRRPAVGRLRGLPAGQGRRGARDLPGRDRQGLRRRA